MMFLLAWLGMVAGEGACVAVEGERLRASDLALAEPAFRQLAPETELGWAPAPGVRRTISAAELARLAARFGVEIPGRPICLERATAPLTREQVIEALERAVARADARLELVDFYRRPLPRGRLEFDRAGLMAPAAPGGVSLWRGRLRYDGNRTLPVWARVRLTAPGRRLVAAANLAPGRPIQASEVRLEEGEWFPFAEPALESLEAAVGKLPRRWIPAGAVLYARLLAAPREVERGDQVVVEVLSGGAQLRFAARAETGGRTGDSILVRSAVNHRRIAARVEGPGKVVIDANAYRRVVVGDVPSSAR